MATILTTQIINDAKASVDTYIQTVNDLYKQLSTEITSLTSEGFQGDAANGFIDFFTTTMTPLLQEKLTGEGSITIQLKQTLDYIDEQLLQTLDPDLGNSNKNAGNSTASN